jgi:spoIIIJ-associated protein
MEYAEAEGRSIDEAIERALQRLGVSRDKVDIDIISNSTRGLFGLGGRRAKVRATLRRPLAPTPAAATAGATPQTPPPPPAPPPPATASAPPRPVLAAPRHDDPRPPRRTAPLDGAAIERGRAVLAEIVRLTGSPATVAVAPAPDGVRLVISGDPSGVLIGRRGQTLDALEYLLNRIMAHEEDSFARLRVDLEDYRQRRQQALEALARRAAERARRRGKPVTLNPMSPRDRRIVHLTLQDDPILTTRSAGSGFYRKVVIVPRDVRRATRSPE